MKSKFHNKVALTASCFMRKINVIIKSAAIIFLFVLVRVQANAAGNFLTDGSISGTVTDSVGAPLISVTVTLQGASSLSKATDNDGKFFFNNLSAGNYTVTFSYVGYSKTVKTVSLAEGEQRVINISLLSESNKLNDIVVIGYGASRVKDVTGSVASVKLKDQEKTPIIGTSQLLEGQVSGVQVTQNQSQPGGSGFSIRIRGTNSINSSSEPLYVIDGYAGGDVAALNPSDIASIDILKDGSATAIYGSRGANGVIIITTKRGRANGKSITVDAYTGVQNVAQTYNMLDAKGYATYLNRFQQEVNETNNTQDPLPYTQEQINALGKGTNWQDEIFRPAQISNVSIGFNGGNADSRYYLSLSYFDQKGIIIGSDYKRGIVKFNLDQNISKKITVGFSSQLSYDFQQSTTVNTSGGGGTSSVLWDAVRFNPILHVKDTSGQYTYVNGPPPLIEPLGNPVAYSNEAQDDNYTLRAFVNAYGEYEIISGLKLHSSFGVNYNNGGRKYFVPTTLYVGATTGGFAMQSAGQNYDWLNENTISYNKNLNANNVINVVGGFTFQRFHDTYFDASIAYLSTDILGSDNLGVGTPFQPSSNFGENVLASYFARANYSLMDKYLFTVTMRADGSSRFGANNKYGYFPSGAFAWRLSEEPFIRNVKAISDMKLRLSYGVTGNQEIGSYNSLSRYVTNSYSLGRDPQQVVGISPDNIANPNLKWESTTSYDGGLDISLFNQRLNFTGDYYYKKTTDLLLNINIPQTSGYGSYLTNIGAVENKGFEFSITSQNITGKNLRWNTTLNFSRNRNKVLSLGSNAQIFAGDVSGSVFPGSDITSAIIEVGKPIGSFYGYVFDGIWQTQDEIDKSGTQQTVVPGDPRYKDLNLDSFIDGSDRTIIGNALPDFTYGINNEIAYKRFTLNVFFQGVYGNDIFNENRYEIESGNPDFNKLAYVLTESWNGPNTSNTLPKISSRGRRSTGVTSDLIENGSFLRLKTLNLSYNIPVSSRGNVFKSATVYVTAQNLVTFTKYSGYDPEVNSFDVFNQLSLGTDYNAYPNYRTFLFGIKFGF